MKVRSLSPFAKWLAEVLVVAAIYVVTGKLGLLMAIPPGNVTTVWPPSGIALAAILLRGFHIWPGIWLGSFLINSWFFTDASAFSPVALAISSTIGLGSTLQALVGALLIRRFIGVWSPFDRAQDVLKFTFIELLSCTVAPTFGVTSLCLGNLTPWSAYAYTWWTWWVGDLIGVIVVAPLVLTWRRPQWVGWTRQRLLESTAFLMLLLFAGQIIFGKQYSLGTVHYPVVFTLIPFVIWAAFRFSQAGVMMSTFIMSGMAIGGTIHGIGPFVGETLNESLVLLQTFVGTVTITGLIIAAAFCERKQASEALAEQAIRDSLTNLYNRRYFNQRIVEEMKRADRNHHTLAILVCDLDHFKEINDTQGHQVGDKVLNRVARGMQNATRGTDLIFRWGGDEFVVVLSGSDRRGTSIAMERIRSEIRKVGDEMGAKLDLSIGVALYPENDQSVDGLIRLADQALYIAKKGGEKFHFGVEEYHLDQHSIKVVFQPVTAVQPITNIRTQMPIGYEALSRDPEGKLSILKLFEKYQAIGKLQELKCICFKTQIEKALEVGLKRVFINVDFNVLSQVEMIPKPPGINIILEISELEAIHDIENRLQIAKKWREEGYEFAIDDFGAGFISLPFIARLVPEYIKVDRSTILQAVSSEQFKEFMIGLTFALNNYAAKGIIAEGIETEKELKVVKDIGIFLVQGFLFGKPQELL